jgi:DNA modification methylase
MAVKSKSQTPCENPRSGTGETSNSCLVERVPIGAVNAYRRELRKHPARQIVAIKAGLEGFGQVMPILTDENLEIIDGHAVLRAAKELGWTSISVIRAVHLNREQTRALRLALNKLQELSVWDPEALRLEFVDLQALDLDFEIEITGFSTTEIDLLVDVEMNPAGEDPADTIPAAGPAVTRIGDLWILGDHRFLCGNALDPAAYATATTGMLADMAFTDPPYGIRIEGNVSGLGKVKHKNFAMGCEEMSDDEFRAFLATALRNMATVSRDGALIYSTMDRRHLLELQLAAKEVGLGLVDLVIWNKLSAGMGSFYRSQHEPVFVFKVGRAPHCNNIELGRHGRHRTTVWDYPGLAGFGRGRTEALAMHPTVKPVALIADAIRDCTRRGDIVLDPFLGSGSTLIAAEKTGRRGFGIELDPRYVDTAIGRWEKLTGREAVHVSTGFSFAEIATRRLTERAEAGTENGKGLPPAPRLEEQAEEPRAPAVRIRHRERPASLIMEAAHG